VFKNKHFKRLLI